MGTLLIAALLSAPADEPPPPPVALVLATRGAVTLTRGASQPRHLGVADLLRPGDRLEAAGEATATLAFLADGRRLRLKPGGKAAVADDSLTPSDASEPVEAGGTPTRDQMNALRRHFASYPDTGGAVGVLRAGDAGPPPVVTPMTGSRVLTDHPTLSWPAVPGAVKYRVEVLSGAEGPAGRLVWRETTHETRLPYPEGEKVLSQGLKYRWRVVALSAEGKEAGRAESFFFVTTDPPADFERVRRLAAGDDPGDWLLAAAVYEARGVYDKALPLYEKLAARWPAAAGLQERLAAYYERGGRPDKAREALDRAKKLNDAGR